ncbi:ferrochelatase [Paenibacillus phyllosphaerae]|uniref:Coproporphyrin III ferrochelatase n=1 Tax=Paenibacillus phyllosphaerae TaxID=274593 RepID=A0A7W5AW79_9BACL|nr:ferrochelatase [Paenibacillus phyllosphaerae]MBB3109853.1 ferrochelatase [Paenibacillus phyllosphaerae]
MSNERIGVLVMSYGTPESLDGVEEYYTHIRRGNPPTPELLDELKGRYEAVVGGVFPLRENTNNQVAALQKTLDAAAPGRYVCYQGLKHARPYIEDGVEAMAKDGITKAIGIVLAPHYSMMSVGGYIKRAKEKAGELGVAMSFVESYHLHPKLIEALVDRVVGKLGEFDRSQPIKVLFSAHSLPERIREMGDPYEKQLLETSEAVANKAGVADWSFTWQSAGRTHEPWLGPDILDTLKELADQGMKQVLSAPVGFVSDHLEVLYDLDIEAKAVSADLDIHFERIDMLNTDAFYMEALAESVVDKDEWKA